MVGNLHPDATKYNLLDVFKLIFMVGDIRFSEDCCVADTYIVDMANFGLGHVAKITFTAVKKLEVCATVSSDHAHFTCDGFSLLASDYVLRHSKGLCLH
jgi:hypothetical protein